MKVLAGTSNLSLCKDIARNLKLKLVNTNIKRFAEKMQLIRNHGEAVVEKKGVKDLTNMIGFNFRLGETKNCIVFVFSHKTIIFLTRF